MVVVLAIVTFDNSVSSNSNNKVVPLLHGMGGSGGGAIVVAVAVDVIIRLLCTFSLDWEISAVTGLSTLS